MTGAGRGPLAPPGRPGSAGSWAREVVGWAAQAVGWLYPEPPLCLICRDGQATFLSEPLCPQCLETLPRFNGFLCERCGQPTAGEPVGGEAGRMPLARFGRALLLKVLGGPMTCARCRREPPPFTRAVAVAPYRGWIRAAVHRLKYRGEAELAVPLGRLMGLVAREALGFATFPVVVPVPLHPERLRARGYNQSELLAVQVAAAIRRPLRAGALKRVRPTAMQVGLSEGERRRNLQGALAAADSSAVRGRSVLLVDDVLTTGATCREATRVLLEAGARRVDVLTLAVTPAREGDPRSGSEEFPTHGR